MLVNNVGNFNWKTVSESTPEEWQELIAGNLFSVFFVSRAVLPAMRRQRWGRDQPARSLRASMYFRSTLLMTV